MKRFNENQIVINLMGQSVGDVQLFARNAFRGTATVCSALCTVRDGERDKTLALLMREQNSSEYAWHLTVLGAQYILENLSGCYNAPVERKLSQIANAR